MNSFFYSEDMVGGYGGENILKDCSISVNRGEISVIVGPNGAGKSTAMKAMLGMLTLSEGKTVLNDKDITNYSPQNRIAEGISFVPQTMNIFSELTVKENLEMGAYLRQDDISETIHELYNLFPILYEKREQVAGELSGGQRQQVAVGRALMTQPSVLMLDEPTAGVSPVVMDELFEKIIDIKNKGVAIIIVEQNAKQALGIADYGHVLVAGENKYDGKGKELLQDNEVRKSFLGG